MTTKDLSSPERLLEASENKPARYSAPRLIKYGPVSAVTGSGCSGFADCQAPGSGPMGGVDHTMTMTMTMTMWS